MSYLVLARKWRPRNFKEVVGQTHVTRTLMNAIEMDRVAHAFIFSGVRGVGKTSMARILAKSLNCANGPTIEPCGTCASCSAVAGGTAVDVIEIDGASNNSVDDIRELRETVPYRPAIGRFKIYVIDEVHMLSTSAFNALLKTLEEPPPHVKFIFATTESHKIPVTILSRCQRYDFRRIPTAAIIGRVREILQSNQIEADEAALALVGREAEGSMRDALSILDRVLAAGFEKISADAVAQLLGVADRQVFFDLSRALLAGDPRRCLEIIRDVDHQGYDIPTFAKGLLEHLRNLVVAAVCGETNDVLDLPDEEKKELLTQSRTVSSATTHRLFKHFSEAYDTIVKSGHPRIMLETALARIADLGELVPAVELLQRLEALSAGRQGIPGGTPPRGGGLGSPGSGGGRMQRSSTPGVAKPTLQQAASDGTALRMPPLAAPDEKKTVMSQPSAPLPVRETRPVEDVLDAQRPSVNPPRDPGTFTVEAKPSQVATQEVGQVTWDNQTWQRLVEGLRQKKPQLASILECGVPQADSTKQTLKISFAGEYASLVSLAQMLQGDIEAAICTFCGYRLRVDVVVDQAVSVPVATQRRIEREELSRQRAEEARQHPLVRQAVAQFGGTIANVRLIDNN